jgi:hypothetical protein
VPQRNYRFNPKPRRVRRSIVFISIIVLLEGGLMKRFFFLQCVTMLCWASVGGSTAFADVLFESGTLGPTGIPRSEIAGGSNVSPVVFVGARFHLDQPVITTQIGGHFVKNIGANESFFGAIVALANENDFPDSGNLSTPDVVGTSLLSFPEPSDEVFGTLAKPLTPGWYALVFGSGMLDLPVAE